VVAVAERRFVPADVNIKACGPGFEHFATEIGRIKAQIGIAVRPGDWRCPDCDDWQFAKNPLCRFCMGGAL
jgi:hypothetical protein